MLLGAPGASENPASVAAFVALASCPFVCGGSLAFAWIQFEKGHSLRAGIVILAPLINIIVLATAYYVLETFYDGKLGS